MSTCSQKSAKIVMQRWNPYLNTDYNSLYNLDPEKETFSNIKDTKIRSYAAQVKTVAQSNQKAKIARLIKVMKPKVIIKNPFTDSGNYEIIKKPKYALEAETETTIKPRSVMGIKTPLDTMSIAL